MKDVTDWQLCKISILINGLAAGEQKEWDGICHVPSSTFYKIYGNEAKIIAQAVRPDKRTEERMKKLAVKLFYSCHVSYRPNHQVIVKRGRQYVM